MSKTHYSRRQTKDIDGDLHIKKFIPSFISGIRVVRPSGPSRAVDDDILNELRCCILDKYKNYRVKNVKLHDICTYETVKKMFNGEFSAVACDTAVDKIAISSNGHLLMRLTENTYSSLGVPFAKQSIFNKREYCIDINLLENCYRPEKKGYERIIRQLSQFENSPLEFMICSSAGNESILACEYEEMEISVENQRSPDEIIIPSFDNLVVEDCSNDSWENSASEAAEWFGLVELGAWQSASGKKINPFLSTYQAPNPPPNPQSNHINITNINAHLLSSNAVFEVLKVLQRHVGKYPWIYVHAFGHPDAPVSLWNKERNCGSDNDLAYILLPSSDETVGLIGFRHVGQEDASL